MTKIDNDQAAVDALCNLTMQEGDNRPFVLHTWKGDERVTAARAVLAAIRKGEVSGVIYSDDRCSTCGGTTIDGECRWCLVRYDSSDHALQLRAEVEREKASADKDTAELVEVWDALGVRKQLHGGSAKAIAAITNRADKAERERDEALGKWVVAREDLEQATALLREARKRITRLTNHADPICDECRGDATADGSRHRPECVVARIADFLAGQPAAKPVADDAMVERALAGYVNGICNFSGDNLGLVKTAMRAALVAALEGRK